MPPAIQVHGLSKRYRIRHLTDGAYRSLREDVTQLPGRVLRSVFGRRETSVEEEFWALRDVSFEAQPGEVLGIIGQNGAGKSTLLKLLGEITRPTEGSAILRGRVGALLEVGAGFHAELTGRENIFLNGAILGMSRAEVRSRFDEIVAFAEIERFLDTPVKRYSSGMYTRLGFSIAAHLNPEIMLIDEVLSVGDAGFQRRCLGKIDGLSGSGRTILFVSHNMQAIRGLCEKVIVLERGRIAFAGDAESAIRHYLERGGARSTLREWSGESAASSSAEVRLHSISIHPADDSSAEAITMETPIRIGIEYSQLEAGGEIDFTIQFCFEGGAVSFPVSSTHCRDFAASKHPGRYRVECTLPGGILRDGEYTLNLLVLCEGSRLVWREDDVLTVRVQEPAGLRKGWFGRRPGVACPLLDWSLTPLDESRDSG